MSPRVLVLTALVLTALAVACGPARMPTGPAPVYEDPPPPSWMVAADAGARDAAPEPAPALAPAGAAVPAS